MFFRSLMQAGRSKFANRIEAKKSKFRAGFTLY